MKNIFDKDWFDRSDEYIGHTYDTLNWSDTYSSYSEFIYNKNRIENMKNNHIVLQNELSQLANQICSFNTLTVDPEGGDSMTDGKRIVVANSPILNSADVCKGLDILFGLAIHECCHCKYTNFNISKRINNKIVHYIFNILEDEIIEQKVVNKYPGFTKFLGSVKHYYFNKTEDISNFDDWQNLLCILLYTVRYPKQLIILPTEKYEQAFIEVKQVLIDCDILNISLYKSQESDTNTVYRAALHIYNIFTKYFGQETQNALMMCKNIMIGESQSETNDKNISNKIEQVMKKCESINKKFTYANNDSSNKVINIETSSLKDVEKYNNYLSQVRKYIKDVSNIINIKNKVSDEVKNINSTQNGQLDPSKLALAMMDVNNIHKQVFTFKKRISGNINVVLMIDESGSMRKITDQASRIGILFYEAMKLIPDINVFVYGHGENVIKYVDINTRDKYVLGNRKQQKSQNEEASYRVILEDVLHKSNKPTFVVNITDSIYLDNPDNIKKVFGDYKNRVYFSLVTISNENAFDFNKSINDMLYGHDNYINVGTSFKNNVTFRQDIKRIAKVINNNIKKIIKGT